jgi:hypothetical protein
MDLSESGENAPLCANQAGERADPASAARAPGAVNICLRKILFIAIFSG